MKIILLAFLMLLASPLANARIYKWIDASGAVHYSESPPPGSNAQELWVAPNPPSAETDKAQTEARQLLENERRKKEVRLIEDTKRARECDGLRAMLFQLKLPGPYSQPLDGGNVLVVTVAGKPDFRKKIEEEIRAKCN
jgi:hypothetical protein